MPWLWQLIKETFYDLLQKKKKNEEEEKEKKPSLQMVCCWPRFWSPQKPRGSTLLFIVVKSFKRNPFISFSSGPFMISVHPQRVFWGLCIS